jgi:hypothetical protein
MALPTPQQDTRARPVHWHLDVTAAARERAWVLRGTGAARLAVLWLILCLSAPVIGGLVDLGWFTGPVWLAIGLLAFRWIGRMRHGHQEAVWVGSWAAGGVAVFTIAWLSGADLGPAGEVAEGAFTGIGESLRFYSEWPEFRLIPTIGIMLMLNASRFGAILASTRAGRRAPVRWLLLYLAAGFVLIAPLTLAEQGRLEGWPIWAVPAGIAATWVLLRVSLGVVPILRAHRHGSPPFPWEPESSDRGRRLFTGRHLPQVIGLLALSIGVGFFGLAYTRGPIPDEITEDTAAVVVLLQLFGLGLLWLAAKLYVLARQWAARDAAEVRQDDGRPPILYLRSFADDDLRIRTHASRRQAYVERLAGRSSDRFEAVLVWHLWTYGPVTAVGRPAEKLPPLGAAREYLDDDIWRDEIEERVKDAEAIVVVLGRSSGLLWELEAIVRLGAANRTMVVIPPVPEDERLQRWTALEALATRIGLPVPTDYRRWRALVLTFDSHRGGWGLVTADWDDEYGYEVALEAGMASLVHTQPPPERILPMAR